MKLRQLFCKHLVTLTLMSQERSSDWKLHSVMRVVCADCRKTIRLVRDGRAC